MEKLNKKKEPRGYKIIEPPIHEELDWSMEKIMNCLEFIRNELPKIFSHFPKHIEYDLIAMTNFANSTYPVIGVFSIYESDYDNLLDDIYLEQTVENWLKEFGIKSLIENSKNINVISWKELQKVISYPKR